MRESELLGIIREHDKVHIYGAGMVGSLVLFRLKEHGIEDGKIDFFVSRSPENHNYLGYDVRGLDDSGFEDGIYIVAVLPKNQRQLIENLKENGIDRYVVVDNELYLEMEVNYISKYMNTHDPIKGDRDILFMSSDNNYTSGAFLCMIDLCKEMKERGIRPLVVLPCFGNAEKMLCDNGIEYTFVQSSSGLIEVDGTQDDSVIFPDAIDRLEELIRKHGIRIVHNNTDHTYVGAEAARKLDIPYIWHIRENIREQGLKFADEDYSYNLINGATAIVAVSRYVSQCYPRLDQNRVRVIYDGVEAGRYYRQREILCDDTVHILMPGIMVPLKGQHQLVKAAIKLRDSLLRFDISFVGSGDADYIRALEDEVRDNGLADKVSFEGRVDDLENRYQKADIVVVSSRSEAFGRVTVEAQLSGCVVIGAACGATIELISDGVNGYLYELDNSQMLADKINEVCVNREVTREAARRGQLEALQKYDRSVCSNKVIGLYNSILK